MRLKQADFNVRSATSADAAAEIVFRMHPDLILLDINMEGYSGLEFHECLRITERGRRIPVVYISGQDNPIHRENARKQEAAGFVIKPYCPFEIIELINEILAAKSAVSTDNGNQ